MKYIIDAHAWIEYLRGSSIGQKVNDIIESDNEICTLTITIAEVVSKIKRKKENSELAYHSIVKNSSIIEPTLRMARKAGLLHAEKRKKMPQFGIVDSLIIATATELQATIVTSDMHFKDASHVLLLQ